MLFLGPNQINTTSQILVDSNTTTVENLIDRNIKSKYLTSGYTGATKTTISIEFGTLTTLDKLFLQNHNLKTFRVFYNSATANTLNPDINVSGNSQTSSYYSFAAVQIASLQLQIDAAMTGVERFIGELFAGRLLLDFERNPSAADYDPTIYRKQVRHEMPDGGVALYNIDDKFRAKIKWKYVSETFKNDLLAIYETGTAFCFVPMPTTSSWDGKAYEVAWSGPFDFTFSDNAPASGFSGSVNLEETS